ncbi:RNase adapter RapZ [Paludicola sp. MB14-C6]|uniref:RNase adapter RapZ n=1 Tax=Paludihabitans sp. MB14-C6 TaxID=3070656 RepID=UPI0027DB69F8|nr:RNase adapter RapZ [Paludicola sp. MB14-C6]WMJ23324.1 RNase adapter RapZ [Paludicola sp. MB14-C6]
MDFLIVTGLSGAGKSRAVDALEDIGFFCIDNMPPKLISKFAEIAKQSGPKMSKVAVVTDVRGGELFNDFIEELDLLKTMDFSYKLLFLDCNTQILVRRYKETRRKHPLIDHTSSIEEAVVMERDMLMHARERSDYIIDTSHLSAMQLKERISNIFLDNISNSMLISCMSFGFKYGSPAEADLVFDVRCLPNPFYIDELKNKTGLEDEVKDYVMAWPQSQQLRDKLIDLIDYLIPLYLSEGKSQLIIAVGCTGGKHRSITFAEEIYNHLLEQGKKVAVNHRDILKP